MKLSTLKFSGKNSLIVLFFVFIAINGFLYLNQKSFLFGLKGLPIQVVSILAIFYSLWKKPYFLSIGIVSIFAIYLSFTNPTPSGDLIPARFSPYWLDEDKNFGFDNLLTQDNSKLIDSTELTDYSNQITGLPYKKDDGYIVIPYYMIYHNQQYLPTYPLVTLYYNYIIYQIGTKFILKLPDLSEKDWLYTALPKLYIQEKFSAAILATFSCLILFHILRLHPFSLSQRSSLLLTYLFAFGTSHFSNSSQGLWQHGLIEFFLLLVIFLIFKFNRLKWIGLSILGVSISLMFFTRPNSVILLLFPFLVYLLSNYKNILNQKTLIVVVSLIVSFGIFGYINVSVYDNLLGGYIYMKQAKSLILYNDLFTFPLWKGFISLLFSPGFGYFVFSPVLLLCLFGLYRKKKLIFSMGIVITFVLYIAFYSKYIFWEGGHSYGARFLTDANPLMIFLLAFIFPYFRKKKITYILFLVLFSISAFIQFTGTKYKSEISLWNSCKYSSSFEKAWDFNNLPYSFPYKKNINCVE